MIETMTMARHRASFAPCLMNMHIEATESFRLRSFFKEKERDSVFAKILRFLRLKKKNDGIFAVIDPLFFQAFDAIVPASPRTILVASQLNTSPPDEAILYYMKQEDCCSELDLGHLRQMCEKTIILKKEKWLSKDNTNLIIVRGKGGELVKLTLQQIEGEWHLFRAMKNKGASGIWSWGKGTRIFHE